MVFACGLSNYSVGIFHLTNHAFFKALLFLSAGSIIHSINDEQDMRKMGGLRNLLPFTYVTMVCGSLALIGFPFLTGFYSKDLILEAAYGKHNLFGYFSYFLGVMGAFFTAFYSTRLVFLTFLVRPNGYKRVLGYSMDSGFIIKFVLGLLTIPSVFAGYFCKDMVVGVGTGFFGNAIYSNPRLFNTFDAEFIPLFYKVLPINLSLLGVISAFCAYSFLSETLFVIKSLKTAKKVYVFLNKKWFFDKIYNEYFNQLFFKLGYSISYKFIDRGVFELLGPTGLSHGTLHLSTILHKSQTNSLYHITLTIVLSITLLFFVESFRQVLIQSELFFNLLNEYSSSLNYLFSAMTDLLSFELLFINLIAILLLVKK
jgi:NADH-ubiquinone oxidoreductase chain 5